MANEQTWGVWECYAGDPTPKKSTRHWEGAQTDRLNFAHWENASDNPVADLRTDLVELQRRVRHESMLLLRRLLCRLQ